MSSSQPGAAGNTTPSIELDAKDELLLVRFRAAGGEHLFEYPDNEETQGKKGKKDRARRRTNRDARNKAALATLESGMAAAEPTEPNEQEVASEAAGIQLNRDGVRWRCHFIQTVAHVAEYGVPEGLLQPDADDERPEIARVLDALRTSAQAAAMSAATSGDAAAPSDADEASMAMARQRAQQRLEQQQQLASERRRKLLAETMSAAQVAAAAAAEDLKLEGSDNLSGFKGVIVRDASLRKPYQAVHADESLGYYATAEEAALVYARHRQARADAEAAQAEAAAAEEDRAWQERVISRGLDDQSRTIEYGITNSGCAAAPPEHVGPSSHFSLTSHSFMAGLRQMRRSCGRRSWRRACTCRAAPSQSLSPHGPMESVMACAAVSTSQSCRGMVPFGSGGRRIRPVQTSHAGSACA